MSRFLDEAARLDPQRAADLSEQDERMKVEADLAFNVKKGERKACENDAHALDMQIQMQGYIGWLPA